MSRIAICVLLAATLAAGSGSRQQLQGNYDNIQTFVVSFMTAYEGASFNSSAVCFGGATSSKLDADLVAMMKSLTFGRVEDFSIYLQAFISDLHSAFVACQMTDIETSFHNIMKHHGWEYIAGNVFWRALDIVGDLGKAVDNLLAWNIAGCGTQLGSVVKCVIPPTFSAHLAAVDVGEYVKGVLTGLEVNPGAADACYDDLTALSGQIDQTQADFSDLISGDISAVFPVISDLRKLLTALQGDGSDCNAAALAQVLMSLLTRSGVATVVNNFNDNLDTIVAASKDLSPAVCEGDLYQCGFSTGEIVRLTLGWGI